MTLEEAQAEIARLREALSAVAAWFKEMDDPDGPYDVKSGTPVDVVGHLHRVEALRNAAKAAVYAIASPPPAQEGPTLRELVEQWREEEAEWRRGLGDNVRSRILNEKADELDAALKAAGRE